MPMSSHQQPDKLNLASKLRVGDDTTPVFATVRDKRIGWGFMTSKPRSESKQYQEFLNRARKDKNNAR